MSHKDPQSIIKKLPDNQIVFFQSQDGLTHVEVMYAEENIWLNQKKMAELFGCSVDNISCISKIFIKKKSWMKKQLPRISR